MRTIIALGALAASILVTMAAVAGAAPDPIPRQFHGMWAAGTCAAPYYFLNIEGSGMQSFMQDRRTPIGNWDVKKTEWRESTVVFDVPETNSGKKFHFELFAFGPTQLRIKIESGGQSETKDFEACPSDEK